MRPIGLIHTPFTDPQRTPIQAARSTASGQVEVHPEFAGGLEGLDGFSHIHLLYIFHRSSGFSLRVKPFLDDQVHGVYATRHPARPNAIGLSVVKLLSIRDNVLEVEGVDMLDGTPLLDIKPYVPEFDLRMEARTGWFETRSHK